MLMYLPILICLFLPPGGPFTLFAPVDAAFDKFAGKAIGKKEATQIVNKHLVRILPQIKLENSFALNSVSQVEGTIYSLGLIGHTYDTLSGATINTSAMQNQKDIYVVKEGDQTANILVSFDSLFSFNLV